MTGVTNPPRKQCGLESLPPELKVMIMSHFDSELTLYHMILASESYKAAYLPACHQIRTTFVLREFINVVIEPVPFAEVQFYSDSDSEEHYYVKAAVKAAIEAVRKQHREGPRICLDEGQFTALQWISHYVPWYIARNAEGSERAYCNRPGIEERAQDHSYELMFFADDGGYPEIETLRLYIAALNDARNARERSLLRLGLDPFH